MIDETQVERRELWTGTHAEAQLAMVTSAVVAALSGSGAGGPQPFCLWLQGDLGAGKTTLTGWILRRLGLAVDVPVTSPTYTYMNDYQIGAAWYAHLDLYRARADLATEDLGLADGREFRGLFVEWPERLARDPHLAPTHVLEIASVQGGAARHYVLDAVARRRG